MRRFTTNGMRCTATLLVLQAAASAFAAGSINNSLTGFSGASNEAALQGAAAAAGFEFASTDGLADDFSVDPRVFFAANGATFGRDFAGDGGRNYMRTIDDYAFDSFTAAVTVTLDTLASDQVFFGIGSGDIALWGTPDFSGVPSLFITPEPNGGSVNTNGMQGISGDWENPEPCTNNDWCKVDVPALVAGAAGTHRLQMTLDATAKTWVAAIDVDYAGGPFVADGTSLVYDLTNWYDDGGFVVNGWPTLPSKIYFGGDDGAVFTDFSVTVASAGQSGDFNGDGAVDAADYTVWRDNLGAPDESSIGGNGDGQNGVDPEDFNVWKTNFGVGGAGSRGPAAVPEPSSLIVMLLGLIGSYSARRRL